ncbi:hypothetical protein Pan161_05740 [Gimesia algae]|uniref:Uncharacterized protein n=2 Tax=Gimesia algae TaxID=2527971 RepID=A0A517V7H8_9PLAN|nr:hypothetical protein Pan161_05740 [Gimesia algae]
MIMNQSKPESADRDLNWIAFQYITNELSADDSLQFESLLAENQSAREALAHATQLMAGLHVIESMPATVTPRVQSVVPRRSLKWIVISCSVAAMLFLTISLLPETQAPESELVSQPSLTDASEEDLEHLLNLWSESAEENHLISQNTVTESSDALDQQTTLAESHSLEIPDWLYTAVSLPDESVN